MNPEHEELTPRDDAAIGRAFCRSLVVLLVVGAVVGGISFLLEPHPPAPQTQITQLDTPASPELPAEYRYELDIAQIAEVWRRGSVVGSWLLDLTAMALCENPDLSNYTGFVHDSGEGRWTIMAALEEAVPAEVLSSALYTRFRSRQTHTFAEKVLSAMRNKFGGHLELPSGG